MTSSDTKRSAFTLWFQAVRPFSLTASITPVLLGTALAYFEANVFSGLFFTAAMIGGLLLHMGTNLINDYYDFKKGADTIHSYGSSRVLVEGLMAPPQIYRGAIVCFALAFVLGIFLVAKFGWVIVVLGLLGIVGGWFYTANPLSYKYRAMGEPLVFTLMGPLMVFGAYFVQVEKVVISPFLVSIPIAILVAGILYANNLRDRKDDERAGFSTIPKKFKWKTATRGYLILISTAFVSLVALVLFSFAPIWALLALIAIAPTLKLKSIIDAAKQDVSKDLATLDVSTAQVHFLFGILLSIGFILGAVFG